MRSVLTKAEHPWRAEQKGRNERSKSNIFQWMNGSGRVEPSKSTGCPHQLCILKDHSGPGLSLLVKGRHEHRSGGPWEEIAEVLMAQTIVMEEEHRCRCSPGRVVIGWRKGERRVVSRQSRGSHFQENEPSRRFI